jgi:hypothetical protein
VLPASERLTPEWKPALLEGVEVIRTKAVALSYDAAGEVKQKDVEVTAIPYYAWANRGPGQMQVWIADSKSVARPTPYPTLATRSTVTVSGDTVTPNGVKDPKMVADGEDPTSSSDENSYFDWSPKRGSTEWIQYTFPAASTVSEAQVYWFDDTGRGRVRPPASWRILYKNGESWQPVENQQAYGMAKNAYNRVIFKPVKTEALRLEVQMQPEYSAGIEEWKVK